MSVNNFSCCTGMNLFPKVNEGSNACCVSEMSKQSLLKVVDQICRIAIGILAAYLVPGAFAIFAVAGAVIGVTYTIVSRMDKDWVFPLGDGRPVCAQGYMDFLTGVRFPPVIGSLATAAFIAAHMRHDPIFYVPFCGACTGFWLGRAVVGYCL